MCVIQGQFLAKLACIIQSELEIYILCSLQATIRPALYHTDEGRFVVLDGDLA
jgi:hypothetical protein